MKNDFLSFYKFFKYFLKFNRIQLTIRPFHKEVCDTLQNVCLGVTKEKIVIINISPRVGKTKLMEALACWTYAYFSDSHIINASYADDLATATTRAVLETLKSEWFNSLFGNVTGSIQQADHFKTKYGGVMKGAGLSGKLTGFGAGLKRKGYGGVILIDDAQKPAEAHSQASCKHVQQWFTQVMTSRRNSPETPIVICAQRISEEDICGYVISKFKDQVIHLKYPALVDGKSTIEDTISTDDLLRLQEIDPFTFFSQYQQEPIVLGGNIIKTNLFRYYDDEPNFEYTILSADTALKTKEHNDFSVISVWGILGKNAYLIDIIRGKFESYTLESVAVETYLKYSPRTFLIEDKASGTGLIQNLIMKGIPVQAVQVDKDKLTRLMDVLPFIAVGNVFLRKNADYLPTFLSECAAFKGDMTHKHDDQIDSMTQLLTHVYRSEVSILDCL